MGCFFSFFLLSFFKVHCFRAFFIPLVCCIFCRDHGWESPRVNNQSINHLYRRRLGRARGSYLWMDAPRLSSWTGRCTIFVVDVLDPATRTEERNRIRIRIRLSPAVHEYSGVRLLDNHSGCTTQASSFAPPAMMPLFCLFFLLVLWYVLFLVRWLQHRLQYTHRPVEVKRFASVVPQQNHRVKYSCNNLKRPEDVVDASLSLLGYYHTLILHHTIYTNTSIVSILS